ncbi:MAG TPA: DUF975 family protein [bacterium]|nr:DUF975 family protein [bacterium]
MTNIFTIKEVVNYSWEKVKKHLGFFILLSIIIFLITYIPQTVNKLTTTDENQFSVMGILFHLIFWFLQIIVSIGITKLCLNVVYDKIEKPKIKDLFSGSDLFIKYLLASILFSAFVFLPTGIIFAFFILMMVLKVNIIINIILGILGLASLVFMIIYSIRLSYYPYFIIEGLGIIESLKKSYKITKGLVWSLMVLGFVLGLINLLGLLCLGVGLLVTIPISYIATAYVYKKMKEVNFNNPTPPEIKSESI